MPTFKKCPIFNSITKKRLLAAQQKKLSLRLAQRVPSTDTSVSRVTSAFLRRFHSKRVVSKLRTPLARLTRILSQSIQLLVVLVPQFATPLRLKILLATLLSPTPAEPTPALLESPKLDQCYNGSSKRERDILSSGRFKWPT